MKKIYINNVTIINKNKIKKKFYNRIHALQNKILDKIFTDQHNSNIKKINKVNNI